MALMKFELGGEFDVATGAEVRDLERNVDGMFRKHKARPLYKSQPASVQVGLNGVTAGTAIPINVGGPAVGKVWDIRQLIVVTDDRTSQIAVSNQIAGAASGSAALPAGASVTGFTVQFQNPAAAVNGTSALQGLSVATLNYDLVIPTTGALYSSTFATPLAAANAATQISYFVNAIVSGPAYSVTLTGVMPAPWYITFNDSVGIPNLLIPGTQSVVGQFTVPTGTESVFLHFGEELTTLVYGASTGQILTAIVRYAEWDADELEMRSI